MLRNALAVAVLAAGILATSHASAEEQQQPLTPPAPTLVRGVVAGGASTGSVWGVSLTGFHGTAGFDVDHGHLTVPILLEADLGKTPTGLGTGQVALAVGAQAHLGRVRFGGGGEATYFWLSRVQGASMPAIDAIGFGLWAGASVDLFDFGGDRALALGVRGEVVGLRGPDSFFRFDRGIAAPRGAVTLAVRF